MRSTFRRIFYIDLNMVRFTSEFNLVDIPLLVLSNKNQRSGIEMMLTLVEKLRQIGRVDV